MKHSYTRFISKYSHVCTGVGIVFLILVVPVFFPALIFSRSLLMPDAADFLRGTMEIATLVVFLLISYSFIKQSSNKKELAKTILAVICAGLLLGFSLFINWFFWDWFPEDIMPVTVVGEIGTYVISDVPGIPEGEGFILYQTYFGIFRGRIASSFRWHRGIDSLEVKLYKEGERTASFTYTVGSDVVYPSQ